MSSFVTSANENSFDELVCMFGCMFGCAFGCECVPMLCETEFVYDGEVNTFECVMCCPLVCPAAVCANDEVSGRGGGAGTKQLALLCVLVLLIECCFGFRLFFSLTLNVVALYFARNGHSGLVAL